MTLYGTEEDDVYGTEEELTSMEQRRRTTCMEQRRRTTTIRLRLKDEEYGK